MQASTNYIYIIFAVVYVIYSIIKAGKKVTQNRPTIEGQPLPKDSAGQPSPTVQPPTATPLPQQDFKKMLEDLLGGVPEEKIPQPQVPKVQAPVHKPEPVKITIRHTPKRETAAVPREKPLSAKPANLAEKTSHPQFYETAKKVFAEPVAVEEAGPDNYREDIDIRQAIIYSEILKRPNW